jgi:hypothetical protein
MLSCALETLEHASQVQFHELFTLLTDVLNPHCSCRKLSACFTSAPSSQQVKRTVHLRPPATRSSSSKQWRTQNNLDVNYTNNIFPIRSVSQSRYTTTPVYPSTALVLR